MRIAGRFLSGNGATGVGLVAGPRCKSNDVGTTIDDRGSSLIKERTFGADMTRTSAVVLLALITFSSVCKADDISTCSDRNALPEEVSAACSRAIGSGKLNGRNLAVLHYNRGVAETRQKKHAEAIPHYSQAIRVHSSYAPAYLNRAAALVQLERYDEAEIDYRAALKHAGGDRELRAKAMSGQKALAGLKDIRSLDDALEQRLKELQGK